jgi:hypothetical protein
VRQHPFPKPNPIQKLPHHRARSAPGCKLFVRERNLNLTNTIRTRTLCFVLHFFVLLSFFPNKGTVKHLSLSEKLKCKMWVHNLFGVKEKWRKNVLHTLCIVSNHDNADVRAKLRNK